MNRSYDDRYRVGCIKDIHTLRLEFAIFSLVSYIRHKQSLSVLYQHNRKMIGIIPDYIIEL